VNDTQLAQLSALTSLNEMMRSGKFDISTVTEVAKALGAVPDAKAMDILRPLHCMEISRMPPELQRALPQLIERCINVPAYQFQVTALTPEQQQRLQGNTLRLLTREG
jgi:hypothetical protein